MANAALFRGLAQGVPQGIQLGFMAQELKLKKDAMKMQQQAAKAAADQQKIENALAKAGKIISIYNGAPKSIQGSVWQKVAPQLNTLLETDLPIDMPASAPNLMKDFESLIKQRNEKKIGTGDFLFQVGALRAMMDKETSTQVGDILGDLPGTKQATSASTTKVTTPEEARKRATELRKSIVSTGRVDDFQAMLISINPDMADKFGNINQKDLAAFKSTAIRELQGLQKFLPENERLQFMAPEEYKKTKEALSKRLGRPVDDTELMQFILPLQ